MTRQRVGLESAEVVWWRSLFLNKHNEWWLVIDGVRQRRISGYEAHAIQTLLDGLDINPKVVRDGV